MAVLGITSFLGAMVEAVFLVLTTSLVVTLASGENEIGPILDRSVGLPTAVAFGALLLLLRLGFNLLAVKISARMAEKVRVVERRRLADAYLNSSWAIQDAEPPGRLQELLTSFIAKINTAVTAATRGLTAVLSLLAFMATGFGVNASAAGAVLFVLALLGITLTPVRRGVRRRALDATRVDIDFAKRVAEVGALGMETQTFGVGPRFSEKLKDLIHESGSVQHRVQFLQGVLSPLYTAFAYGAMLLGIVALSQVEGADLTTAGAVALLMLRSLSYGQQLVTVAGVISGTLPSLERVDVALSTYESNPAPSGTLNPRNVTPIEFLGVSFAYGEDRESALSGVTLKIETGETLGIIGPSGAGKSTFAQLLLGLRSPSDGVINVAGVSLDLVDKAWWARHVAFVPQEANLLSGTVAENIRFLRDEIGDDATRAAAADAHILAEIEALPLGFDTHLGEQGRQLSGGQRQRLSIARALAGSPALLVLDEPTSALDGHSEQLVRASLAEIRGRVTIAVIAHRMSTLNICDRIMVVENGVVTAIETPAVLKETSEFYQKALKVAAIH